MKSNGTRFSELERTADSDFFTGWVTCSDKTDGSDAGKCQIEEVVLEPFLILVVVSVSTKIQLLQFGTTGTTGQLALEYVVLLKEAGHAVWTQ